MPLTPIFSLLFGAALGSFLNVVIFRNKVVAKINAPLDKGGLGGIAHGRSHCPFCHKPLTWLELIPILSFIFLRGRCHTCHHALSPQYPFVELTLALTTLILFTPLPTAPQAFTLAILNLAAISLLVVLFVIDLRTMLLPDIFIILLSGVVIVLLFFTNYSLLNIFLGIIVGAIPLGLLWLITRGRGLGLGDVKLMIPLGALFGPLPTTVLLFIAFIIGGGVGVLLLLTGRANMKTPVPFGPFLAGVAILFILIPVLPQIILNFIIG